MSQTLPETGVGERWPIGLQQALADRPEPPEVAVSVEEDGEEEPQKRPAYLRGEFDANLAEEVDDGTLATLASELLEGIESDLADRQDWESTLTEVIDLLGIKLETPSGEVNPQGSISKAHHTLLMEACVRFWAGAHAEFLPASGPVKVRDDNPDPQPGEQSLAKAFELDMNHWLTTADRGYYRDKSRMLFSTGLTGTEFRKVYIDPVARAPVSRWTRGQNLIVSSDAVDLSSAARVTERIMMWPSEVKRFQKTGWWRDVDLSEPTEQPTRVDKAIAGTEGRKREPDRPADNRHTVYETYTPIDLAGFEHEDEDGEETGIPLPYRVSLDRDSRKIVEIRRNWKESDPEFSPRQRYVMFGLIPGLGFYYLGFAHLGGNNERTLTALLRQLIDAGQFANFPGFLIGKSGTRQQTNDFRIPPGGGKEINTNGLPINQVIMPLPYKEPSQVLMALEAAIAERSERLLGMAQLPVGEGRQDIPVGTMIAMVEQTTKVVAAVHKGLHASDAEEFRLLQELFAEAPEALTKGSRRPARAQWVAEEFSDLDLVPASDPNVPSQLVRIMHAVAVVQISQAFPGTLSPQWCIETIFRSLGVPVDPAMYAPPQPAMGAPPPDPVGMAQVQLKQQEQQRKAASEQVDTHLRAAELATRTQQDQADRESKERVEQMRQETERMRIVEEARRAESDRQAETHRTIFQAMTRPQPSGRVL